MPRIMITLILALACTARAQESTIDRDERVQFFRTYATALDAGGWELRVHAWVYEQEIPPGILRAFIRWLGFKEDEVNDLLRSRAVTFLVDNERGERVLVRIGDDVHLLSPTEENGHALDRFRLTQVRPEQERDAAGAAHDVVKFRAVLPEGDAREFTGIVELIPPEGLSVISDIDDTIKISEVGETKALLRRTFLQPYEAVPGMAAAYARWARQGTAFHYLSASPWQLYDALQAFLASASFPAGTLHLKSFRWRDETVANLFQSPEKYKPPLISQILADFPRRRFVLIGDAGEKDPEIYAAAARQHPGQIVHIFIRDLGAPGTRDRCAVLFDGIAAKWTLFSDARELPEKLPIAAQAAGSKDE